RLLDELSLDQPINIKLSAHKIQFNCPKFTITSKLIEGTFPDYAAVIPQNNNVIASINRPEFIKAVELVTIATEQRTSGIKLLFENNKLTLSASNSNNFAGKRQLEIDYNGNNLELGFNPRYLLDVAGTINSENMLFLLNNQSSPILVKHPENEQQLFLVMPMRVV
ncbi:MAG: DNA polymerase III subunit beta, partial [Pseudomonadota bacterium]